MSPISGPAGDVMAVQQAAQAQKIQVALMKKQLDSVKAVGDSINQLVADSAKVASGPTSSGSGRFDAYA